MNPDELHESPSQPDAGDLQLLAFLRCHPQLRERVLGMARRIEEEGGTLDAHRIEDLLVEELRALGHAALSDWATAQEERCFEQAKAGGGVHADSKKNSIGKAPSGGSKSSNAP